MTKEFYPDLTQQRDLFKPEDIDNEKALQTHSKEKVSFVNNVFNHCIFIFNFIGPEDKEEVYNDGI
jgi:hypothetical protein